MFKLFDRYIIKEIIPPFFIGLLVYTFVLLMNQILRLSEIFIAKGVSVQAVLSLLAYLIPSVLVFTVPMSVLMAILAGLSRMSSDVEITACKTLGVSYKRLLRPLLVFSFCGWLLTSFLTLYLAPQANYRWVQMLSRYVLVNVQLNIRPREFNESISDAVIYVEDITRDKDWKNIFVYLTNNPEEPKAIYAKKGRLNFYPGEKRVILELFNGALHSYPLAEVEKYSVTSFEHLEEELNIEDVLASVSGEKRVSEKDIAELIGDLKVIKKDFKKIPESERDSQDYREKRKELLSHWIEAHKKFAIPFACFAFVLIGLPLGASTKKGGRTSGFTLSIALILFYYILITAGEQMAMDGKISPLLGMWGPNILFILIGLYVFFKSLKETSPFSFFSRFLSKERRDESLPKKKRWSLSLPRFSVPFPNILDRYIIRKYVAIFSLIFVSLLMIFVIVTFFERIDNVYEHSKPMSLFFDFIWYSIPEFIHYTLPVSVLISTLLCLGLLTKFNEITAMKACGISLYRIILPVLLLSGAVSFFSFYLQENILPYYNKKAEETWYRINDRPPRSTSYVDRRWVIGRDRDRIFHYSYFDPRANAFSELSIFDFNLADWRFTRRIYSERGELRGENLVLFNFWDRDFKEFKPVKFEKSNATTLTLSEDRDYFLKEWKEPDQMSYGELSRYIGEIKEKGFETVRFKVDLMGKISFPLVSLIVALLSIPFAFFMGKRGALVGIGLSLVIVMVFWGAIGIFRSLGYASYLNVFLAAWGPNLIFGLIGLYLLFTIRT